MRRLPAIVLVLAAVGFGAVVLLGRGSERPVAPGSPSADASDASDASDGPDATGATTVAVSAGGYHTCAIDGAGSASCWGLGDHGQLGGTAGQETGTVAVAMPAGRTFTDVVAGNAHTCAIADDGSVWCWGVDGDGTHEADLNPVHGPRRVPLPEGLRAVSLDGFYHDCAVTSDGAVWCWGRGEEGQLGDGAAADTTAPVRATTPPDVAFTQVVTGGYHTCALSEDGAVWCWGQDLRGQLGDGGGPDRDVPTRVAAPSGRTFEMLTAGFDHVCALTSEGAAWCWGDGSSGQLGDGGSSAASAPVAVAMPEGVAFASIDGGNAHTCAVATDGGVWCWGLGTQGGAAAGSVAPTPVAVALTGDEVATAITGGGFHTCLLTEDGAVRCFGDDTQGQLGATAGP